MRLLAQFKKFTPRLTLGAKFLTLTIAALSATVVSIVWNATGMFKKDNLNTIYFTSDFLTATKADSVKSWIEAAVNRGKVVARVLSSKGAAKQAQGILEEMRQDHDLLFVNVYETGKRTGKLELAYSWLNSTAAAPLGLYPDRFVELRKKIPIRLDKVAAGVTEARSMRLPAGQPILLVHMPLTSPLSKVKRILGLGLRHEYLLRVFAETGPYEVALVDDSGRILAHKDASRVAYGEKLDQDPLVARMLASNLEREFHEFEIGKVPYVGAYAKVGFARMGVISQVPRSIAFETGDTLIRRSILISTLVLSLVFIGAYFFLQTIVSPLKRLSFAAQRISAGQFDTRVEVATRDELYDLATSFNSMSQEIVRLLSATADKARMEKELETAKHVQDTMFPPSEIASGALEIQSYYEPAGECGGDWWGCMELPDNKLLLAVGDATGHGVPAAMVTATAKAACTVLQGLCTQSPGLAGSPRIVLHLLNKAVYESTKGKILMTFFVAVVDTVTGETICANASHDPIYWYHMPEGAEPGSPGQRGSLDSLGVEPGPRLGQNPEAYYQQSTFTLAPGDLMLLYTDGLPEGKNPSEVEWGERRFMRSIVKHSHASCAEVRDGLLADFREFAEGQALHDDITLAICKFRG